MTPAPEVQGYRGMLLFSQQDPGGPSFAQVTVAIKRPELFGRPAALPCFGAVASLLHRLRVLD